uniref:Uncharacterized protein n=1 Tax=Avena sativa TaxID=4498 RepID=A0ACD6A6C3_AVESA
MAPEFLSHVITQKYDLYSLGVIIMEILTGEKACQGIENVRSPRLKINIRDMEITRKGICALDTNETKQWIITGEEEGYVRIWNYETQKKIYSFRLSRRPVKLVKFIQRKQWFAAGTIDACCIHVYSYETAKMQKIMRISSKYKYTSFQSLAVHPTMPYLLSVHQRDTHIWNWDKNWQCTMIFLGGCCTEFQVAFSSQDTIAIPSDNDTVKVWSLGSPEFDYTLSGHSRKVNCLDFFTRDYQEYLVTGSDDLSVKIWDMEKKICLSTLHFNSPVQSTLYRPDLQILITGSEDGSVHLWRTAGSSTYSGYPRLKRTVKLAYGLHSLACLMGRVVIGNKEGVAILDIVNVDNGEKSTDYSEPELTADMKPTKEETSEVIAGSSSELPILDVHLLDLCFPTEADTSRICSLQLTNKIDEDVVFRLKYRSRTELYGIVPPASSYTLILTKEEKDLVLQSSASGDRYTVMFNSESECDNFFEEAEEIGNTVHEVTPKAAYEPQGDATPEIISTRSTEIYLCSIYAHPTERWIITGHGDGVVRAWDSETKKPMNSLKVSGRSVDTVKFIAKRKWIVAGSSDGLVHVCNCVRVTQMQRITSFRFGRYSSYDSPSLAIHPTKPYVLSTAFELWNENKGWNLKKSFLETPQAEVVAFNPNDGNIVASGFCDATIEIWSIVADNPYHRLYGHTAKLNCLEFYKRDSHHYLISGSNDCTAKIWDMQETVCIHTLDIMSPVVSVIPLPDHPYLVTGSYHGTVQLWSSTDFRLERTIHFGDGGPVRGLCFMGSGSVVIGQEKRITIMDIDKGAATRKKKFPLQLNPLKIFSSIKEALTDSMVPSCSRYKS